MWTRMLTPRRAAAGRGAAGRVAAGPAHPGAPGSLLPGTLGSPALSVVAHAALLAAVSAGSPDGAGDAGPPAPVPGERVQWVGVGDGAPGPARPRRPGARAPGAYVVPGHGTLHYRAPGAAAAGGSAGVPNATPGGREAAPLAADVAPAPEPARHAHRRRGAAAAPALRIPLAAAADADAALLVAGAISAVPDRTRTHADPSDFGPPPAAALLSDLLVRAGVVASAAGGVRVGDVPIPLVNNPAPAYPPALLRAGVGGRVEVEFRVDSTGSVEAGSLVVLRSDDARFAEAVRAVLPRLHFLPAQAGARPVAMLVRQPFLFTTRAGG